MIVGNISSNSIQIRASADRVRGVLFDIENFPTWSKQMTSVAVIEKDSIGRPRIAKISVDAGVAKDNVVLEYDWSNAPSKLGFKFNKADLLSDMFGWFQIEDCGNQTTNVTYELTFALPMAVPNFLREKQEQITINRTLSELKEKVEA